jgi:hypothetical protein
VFLTIALATAGLAYRLTQKQDNPVATPAEQAAQAALEEPKELRISKRYFHPSKPLFL